MPPQQPVGRRATVGARRLRWTFVALALSACHDRVPDENIARPRPDDAVIELWMSSVWTRGYSIQMYRDGEVRYIGPVAKDRFDVRVDSVPLAALTELIRRFDEARFFDFDDDYVNASSDVPSSVLTFRSGGRTKRVHRMHFAGVAPPELVALERAVEDAVRVERWMGESTRRGWDTDVR